VLPLLKDDFGHANLAFPRQDLQNWPRPRPRCTAGATHRIVEPYYGVGVHDVRLTYGLLVDKFCIEIWIGQLVGWFLSFWMRGNR
jgi:hypothetical protein